MTNVKVYQGSTMTTRLKSTDIDKSIPIVERAVMTIFSAI